MTGSLWRTYQQLLALAAVGLFFSNLAVFCFDRGLISVPPGRVVMLLCGLSSPLLAFPEILGKVLRMPLVLWVLGYLALVGAGFMFSREDQVAVDALRNAFSAGLTLLTFQVILAGTPAQRMAQRAVLVVTMLSVLLNAYELLHPGVFGRVSGRSAGLYQNPNISGGAIVLGALLSCSVLRRAWRPYLFIFAGLGVLLTFSRGAILAWVGTAGVLIGSRVVVVSKRQVGFAVLALVTAVAVVPAASVTAAIRAASVLTSDQAARVVSGTSGVGSASSAVRAKVARDAWEMFADRPLLGAGLGATRSWAEAESTHNMYLLFLAEFGVVGFLFYVLALVAVVWPVPRSVRGQVLGFCVFWLIWGMVSHNLLEDRPILFGLALAGCLVADARRGERVMTVQVAQRRTC